jgi:hypothetical protein
MRTNHILIGGQLRGRGGNHGAEDLENGVNVLVIVLTLKRIWLSGFTWRGTSQEASPMYRLHLVRHRHRTLSCLSRRPKKSGSVIARTSNSSGRSRIFVIEASASAYH